MVRRNYTCEYRFIIPGQAVSFRSPRAKAYKTKVQIIAKKIIPRPLQGEVQIKLDYFHLVKRKMDMDNVAKCVMDALNKIAYDDDKQAKFQRSTAHDISKVQRIVDCPIDLVKPLKEYTDYLFIRLKNP